MRALLLMRHAKSDWAAAFQSDHDRPLNARGRRSAALMGRFLSSLDLAPGRVITSTALRARTTVEIASEAGGWSCPIESTLAFYDSSPETVLGVVRQTTEATETLLIAGHEPVWSELVSDLIGGGRVRMVTASVAALGFEVGSWAEVAPGRGTLLWLVGPRQLAEWAP